MATDIIDALRTQLITAGVCRKPAVAGSLPPCWAEPRSGVPAPGEPAPGGNPTEIGATLVLGIRTAPGRPQLPFVGRTIRHSSLDIWIRSKTAPDAYRIENQIRAAIDEKIDWQMGGLRIISSKIERELQLLTSDDQAFTYIVQYGFEHYVAPPVSSPGP